LKGMKGAERRRQGMKARNSGKEWRQKEWRQGMAAKGMAARNGGKDDEISDSIE
jgi:hypothetical protein